MTPPVYLIALILAVGATHLFRRTSEDIYSVLAAVTAIVSLIVGFALAPWFVQLGVFAVLMRIDRLYLSSIFKREQQREF
jgi:uncharacterized membrane protein YdfJ with MMPL/SSD domain